jgi:3-hydroxyacyl-CoA dehydrogenase
MGSPKTDPRVYERVVAFAKDIGMVPIELHKEQPGYIVNSLLGPLLMAAAGLLLRGVADPATIDTTWRIATGAPKGPFEIFDVIGLRTAYAVANAGAGTVKPGPTTSRPTTSIKANWASNPAKASTHTRCHKRRTDPSRVEGCASLQSVRTCQAKRSLRNFDRFDTCKSLAPTVRTYSERTQVVARNCTL